MIMKKRNKPDQKRYLGYLLLCLWMIWTAGLSVRAAEEKNAVFGTLQALSADAEVKQEAKEDSASVASLPDRYAGAVYRGGGKPGCGNGGCGGSGGEDGRRV